VSNLDVGLFTPKSGAGAMRRPGVRLISLIPCSMTLRVNKSLIKANRDSPSFASDSR